MQDLARIGAPFQDFARLISTSLSMGGSIYLVAAVPWAILAPMNLIKLLLNKARLHTPQT